MLVWIETLQNKEYSGMVGYPSIGCTNWSNLKLKFEKWDNPCITSLNGEGIRNVGAPVGGLFNVRKNECD
jgi:hypothetical protein